MPTRGESTRGGSVAKAFLLGAGSEAGLASLLGDGLLGVLGSYGLDGVEALLQCLEVRKVGHVGRFSGEKLFVWRN